MHDEHVLLKMEALWRLENKLYPVKLQWTLPEEKDTL